MTIELTRPWTDDDGKEHEPGSVLTLTTNEEKALVAGAVAFKTAPVTKPAKPQEQKDEESPVRTEAEQKAELRQAIVDAGGTPPHPSTGVVKLGALLAEAQTEIQSGSTIVGGASNDTLESGDGNDTVDASSGNDTITE